jgi:single-strand DNA-binding protein
MGSMTAIVSGNVGGEVVNIGSTERPGVKFRLGATERYRDRRTGDWVDGKEFWVDVCCWGRLADGVRQSVRRGDAVIVSGRIETDQYTVDGQNRSRTQLTAVAVGHDLSWGTTQFRRHTRKEDKASPSSAGSDTDTAPPGEEEPAGPPVDSAPEPTGTTSEPEYSYSLR